MLDFQVSATVRFASLGVGMTQFLGQFCEAASLMSNAGAFHSETAVSSSTYLQ
jgi:hypothetical protein